MSASENSIRVCELQNWRNRSSGGLLSWFRHGFSRARWCACGPSKGLITSIYYQNISIGWQTWRTRMHEVAQIELGPFLATGARLNLENAVCKPQLLCISRQLFNGIAHPTVCIWGFSSIWFTGLKSFKFSSVHHVTDLNYLPWPYSMITYSNGLFGHM